MVSGNQVSLSAGVARFQKFSFGFAASHVVNPGSGRDKTFCNLAMFSEASGERGRPGKFLNESAVIFG